MDNVYVKQYNGKVGAKAEKILPAGTLLYSIIIRNTSANVLSVSFYCGKWRQIAATSDLPTISAPDGRQIELQQALKFKGSAADTTYEIITVEDK